MECLAGPFLTQVGANYNAPEKTHIYEVKCMKNTCKVRPANYLLCIISRPHQSFEVEVSSVTWCLSTNTRHLKVFYLHAWAKTMGYLSLEYCVPYAEVEQLLATEVKLVTPLHKKRTRLVICGDTDQCHENVEFPPPIEPPPTYTFFFLTWALGSRKHVCLQLDVI